MNILFCGDGKIADGVLISTLSLIRNVNEPLNIYILTATVKRDSKRYDALPAAFADFLDGKVKQSNPDSTARLYDITELFSAEPPLENMDTRFTPCCMLRLYADLIESLPEKILYLDNDVICRLDPAEFYGQDMTDAEIAGTLDYYGSWFFRNNLFRRDYLNSGVLLLNLRKIRETGLFSKCRKRCQTTEMFMPDQSAINKLSTQKIICPRKFNEQRKLKKDTVFQHFTTSFRFFPWFHTVSVKPWNISGMHNILSLHEYDELLQSYVQLKTEYETEEKKHNESSQ